MNPPDRTDDRQAENPYRAPAHSRRPVTLVDRLRLALLFSVVTPLLVACCVAFRWLPAWLIWPTWIVAILVLLSGYAVVLLATAYLRSGVIDSEPVPHSAQSSADKLSS